MLFPKSVAPIRLFGFRLVQTGGCRRWMESFSVLALIWTVYYLAKRKTGGILTETDRIVCGAVILVCVLILISRICGKFRKQKDSRQER